MIRHSRVTSCALGTLLWLHGCCHCDPPQSTCADTPSAGGEDAERARTSASAATQVGHAHPENAQSDDGKEADEPTVSLMLNHFYIAAWARDAVTYGDIESLREPLRSLASYKYPKDMPEGVAELQAAAGAAADAKNLTEAAFGVARMASVCGQCHRRLQLGVDSTKAPLDTSTPGKVDTLGGRMFRHGWAAERLWEGLVAPSDQSWTAGAEALAHAPMRAPKLDKPASEAFVQRLNRIRELGVSATRAKSTEERTRVYAQALATCGQCHAESVGFAIARR